jgi:membrane associated rhomboid family serine protease
MFFPVGDEPNPRGVAWVNWLIIAANVAVYALITLPLSAQPADTSDPAFLEYIQLVSRAAGGSVNVAELARGMSAYDLYVLEHGFRPSQPQVLDLFTCMFLHGGFMHLLGNMVFLWIYGDNVEARLGRLGYLGGYLLTGVAGTLTHALLSGGSEMPLVGASGAISGVVGYYFLLFPQNQVRVLVTLFPIFVRVVRINARWFLGLFFVVWENLVPLVFGGSGPVAYGAHLGGFGMGFILALWSSSRERGSATDARRLAGSLHRPLDRKDTEDVPSTLARLVDAGRMEDAAEVYLESWASPAVGQIATRDSLAVADWLAAAGHAPQALSVFENALRGAKRDEDRARAHLGMGLLYQQRFHSPGQAYAHLRQAAQSPEGTVARQARELLDDIVAQQGNAMRRFDR